MQQEDDTMARAVKDIPVLNGADAKRFTKDIKANESKKVSQAEYDRIKNNFKRFIVKEA